VLTSRAVCGAAAPARGDGARAAHRGRASFGLLPYKARYHASESALRSVSGGGAMDTACVPGPAISFTGSSDLFYPEVSVEPCPYGDRNVIRFGTFVSLVSELCAARSVACGNLTAKRAPPSGEASASIAPPARSIVARTIERPNP
jgi:hypothetical protein